LKSRHENRPRALQKSCEIALGRRAWTSLAEALRMHACMRACVRAYMRDMYLKRVLGCKTRRKKRTYVPTARRQPRHWPARERLVSHTYARLLRQYTYVARRFNSIKRRALPPFISLRGYRCVLKQFATVSAMGFRFNVP